MSDKEDFFNIEQIYKQIMAEKEKEIFEEKKSDGTVIEACLILNPKHKGTILNMLKAGIERFPVLFSDVVEEDKCYMVSDPIVIENIRNNLDTAWF